jgi:elongation factor Ts
VQQLGKELAMQVAASKPKYQTREQVPASVLEQERDIASSTARAEGKPEAAIEKIVEGRVRKFYEETVLVDQAWLREPKKSVSQVLKDAGVTLRKYVRYTVGEATGASTSGAIKETAE